MTTATSTSSSIARSRPVISQSIQTRASGCAATRSAYPSPVTARRALLGGNRGPRHPVAPGVIVDLYTSAFCEPCHLTRAVLADAARLVPAARIVERDVVAFEA